MAISWPVTFHIYSVPASAGVQSGGEYVTSMDANKVKKGVMWPGIVWIVTLILFRIAQLVNSSAGARFVGDLYPIATRIGLVLGVWTGIAVKESKGTYLEAMVGGIILGLACGVPAIILFGLGMVGFAINMVIFSLAVAWAGWNFK